MASRPLVWIVDDDQSIRWVLEKALQKAAMQTRCFQQARDMLVALAYQLPDVLITDIRMPGMDGIALLRQVQTEYPDLPVIVMTAHSDLDSAVAAFHGGAFEYLPKPFDIKTVIEIVQRALKQRMTLPQETPASALQSMPEMIGESPAMQEVFRAIGRLARSHITVLINGESGTGKEVVAKALHRHSPRADKPFIALNMAAIPRDLMESELFGHEKGAFTGANSRRVGRFEQADGGTLFLDEIGDMPAELQTRLLRVLADNEFYPVGAHTTVRVNVRIIAATHQNLEQLVAQGRFREDLFHRLNVIRLHIPPLRERPEDVPLLLRHFLNKAAKELETECKILTPEAERYLCGLPWPGNVRQLENLCRWLTVMASGREVHTEDLPVELLRQQSAHSERQDNWEHALKIWVEQQLAQGHREIAKETIPRIESLLIRSALQYTQGRRIDAAQLLGYGRNTLTRKIKELNINDFAD